MKDGKEKESAQKITPQNLENVLLREEQIIGNPKKGIAPLLPVSRSAFWAGVKSGRFPQPVRLGARTVAWRGYEIQEILDNGIEC
jgi:prophage regulatory protein